jgi:hypothetical protein
MHKIDRKFGVLGIDAAQCEQLTPAGRCLRTCGGFPDVRRSPCRSVADAVEALAPATRALTGDSAVSFLVHFPSEPRVHKKTGAVGCVSP